MHDLYSEGSGRYGLHHVALFVDDVDRELARLADQGFATAQRCETAGGFLFAFADTSAVYGHMLELYAPVSELTDFYTMIADAARNWQGGDVLIQTEIS